MSKPSKHWWVKEEPAAAPTAPRFRGVAYYRHSARDRQENSVAIQQELVQKWAGENGVEIIQEFADRGKSGLTAEGRDGFMPKGDCYEVHVRFLRDEVDAHEQDDWVMCHGIVTNATGNAIEHCWLEHGG